MALWELHTPNSGAEVYLHMALWELHTPNSGKSKDLQPRAHELRLMWAF